MKKYDGITEVTELTEFVPIIIVEKSDNGFRIYLDSKKLNNELVRNSGHELSTFEEL